MYKVHGITIKIPNIIVYLKINNYLPMDKVHTRFLYPFILIYTEPWEGTSIFLDLQK